MWLNLQDAAKYLAVSRATMYRLLEAGHVRGHELPGVRGLRFRSEELDAVPSPAERERPAPAAGQKATANGRSKPRSPARAEPKRPASAPQPRRRRSGEL